MSWKLTLKKSMLSIYQVEKFVKENLVYGLVPLISDDKYRKILGHIETAKRFDRVGGHKTMETINAIIKKIIAIIAEEGYMDLFDKTITGAEIYTTRDTRTPDKTTTTPTTILEEYSKDVKE